MKNKPPVIVILGTNASGKSSLGVALAKKYNGEVISADSRQIFKGFDLCCGKLSAAEQDAIPHHMINICNIGDAFSVSDYQHQVYKLIPEIISRGKLPIIVGGTGLYIDSVTKGYRFFNETIDNEYRIKLNSMSISELHNMLSVNAIMLLKNNESDFNNKRRLIRYIEKEKSGTPISTKNDPLFHVLQLGVTWPQQILHKRIDERLNIRIEQGMLDEVRKYLTNGGNPQFLYDLGLEYKHITWYIEGRYTSFEDFSTKMSIAIKQFAKRQMKWFKRDQSIRWIDMTQDYYTEAIVMIDSFLQRI